MVTNSWRSLLIGVFIILLSIASGRAEVLTGTGFDSFNNGDRPFGWTFTNCNSDADVYTTTNNYGTSSPSIKLDSSTDQILTPSFSSPSQLSFWIKGISTDITSSLLIEEYYSTWTTLTAISPIPTSQVTEWLALTGAATRLRFSYSKSAGNLALDDIAVHKGRYMRVTYLTWTDYGDTGNYGDAVYYEFPGTDGILDTGDDRNLLFDGGRDSTAPCALSKFLDSKIGSGGTIYYMVLSSPGADHYSGLSMAVNRYQVLNYYENCRWPNGDKTAYDTFISDLETEGTNIYYYDAGDYLSGPSTDLGPGWDPNIEARVLCAKAALPSAGDDDNTWSGVIQIRNGESVMIQGGDPTGTGRGGPDPGQSARRQEEAWRRTGLAGRTDARVGEDPARAAVPQGRFGADHSGDPHRAGPAGPRSGRSSRPAHGKPPDHRRVHAGRQ